MANALRPGRASSPEQKPTVLGLYNVWTGCEEYRLHIPFRALREHGWNAYLHNVKKWYPEEFRVDLFVMGRLFPFWEESAIRILDTYQKWGIKFVYETDDDLSNQYRVTQQGDWGVMLRAVDAVTVTNAHLARVVAQHNPNVYVLPNHVDMRNHFKDFRASLCHDRKDPRLTIGLQGSPSHFADWEMVAEPIQRIKKEHPEVRFLLMGYEPEYLQGLADEFIRWQPYQFYVQSLVEIDIGLCPLRSDDPFNLSKSPIKALEYWASARQVSTRGKSLIGGAAVVASDHLVYRRVVNKGNGLLVKDHEWYDALKALITNERKRKELQIKGHQWVKKHGDISRGWKYWAQAYRAILAG